MHLCIGPEGSGKTLLLKQIISQEKLVDTKTIPTVGVNLYKICQPEKKPIYIRELGGSMAPIWHSYYRGIQKIIYVVDASNLLQLGSATLSLLSLISHSFLAKSQVSM
ncbi:UNVERIFIED_CONTAM: hypothetical protein RMT77_000011 [Armadillidium vulgare]